MIGPETAGDNAISELNLHQTALCLDNNQLNTILSDSQGFNFVGDVGVNFATSQFY